MRVRFFGSDERPARTSGRERRGQSALHEQHCDTDLFFPQPLVVVNVGLSAFAVELEAQGVEVVDVDWSPPAGGDPKLAGLLSKLGV